MEAAYFLPDLSKISPPRLPPVLHRQRLDEWFEANCDKSVIFIVGQAAQGKSTVAASWAKRSTIPSAWLSLDVESSDPVNLFQCLIQSLQHTFRETDFSNITDYTSVNMGPRETLPLYREWCRAIFRKIPSSFQIFFDGLDLLSADAPSFRFLQVFIDELPADGRIIAVSRSLPPLQVQRLKMSRRTAILDNDHLAFTPAETGGLFRMLGISLGAPHLQMVQAQTEGWAGGLVLLSEVLRGRPDDIREQLVFEGLSRTPFRANVFEYLGEQVFSDLPSHVRDLLVKLSLLDVIEPSFVKDFLSIEDTAQIMEDLVGRNLFVQCLHSGGNDRLYRLHQLFRDFLSVRFRSETTREERLKLKFMVGALYEQYGSQENAVRYYLDAEAHCEAARVMEKAGLNLLKAGRLRELAHWLQLIPGDLIRQNPWLLFYLCMTRRFSGVEENVRDLRQALAMFEQRKDARGRLLSLAYIIEAMIMRGRFSIPIRELIAKGEAELSSLHGDDYGYEKITLLIQAGLGLVICCGEPHKAVQACMTAYNMAKKLSIIPLQLNALIHCALAFSCQAAYSSAREICEKVEDLLAKYPCAELQCYYSILASLLYSWSGELEKAEQLVQGAIKQAEELGLVYLFPLALLYYMALAPHVKEFDKAEEVANRLIDITDSQGNRMFRGTTTLFLGTSYYFRGEARKCMELLDEAELILSSPESRGESQLNWVKVVRSLASLHLEPERWVDSGQLKEAFAYFSSISDFLRMAECCLAMGLLEAQRGNSSEARAHLQAGFGIAKEKGYSHFSFTSPEDARRAYNLALELNVEPVAGYSTHLGSVRFEPIVLHTLGRFHILLEGKPIESGRKAQKKPLELLKALIAFGGLEVSKETLCDALWPDADGDRANNTFKFTLHQLRRLLKKDTALTLKNGLLSLDSSCFWIDASVFMKISGEVIDLCRKTEQYMPKGRARTVGDLAGQAMELYRGDFLPTDFDLSWTASARRKFRDRMLRMLNAAASYMENLNAWEETLFLHEKTIEIDDTKEESYRKVMECCAALGRLDLGIAAYRRCRSALLRELGTRPSPKTDEVYRSLLRQ